MKIVLYINVFVQTSSACLAQLLKEMTSLPEDLALHYLHQSLGALEHLHCRKVLHLDVKGTVWVGLGGSGCLFDSWSLQHLDVSGQVSHVCAGYMLVNM